MALEIGIPQGLAFIGRNSPKLLLDAQIIAEAAPKLTEAIVKLAEQDKAVRAWLLQVTTQSAYVNVLVITLFTVVLPIADNHGLLGIFSARSPFNNGHTQSEMPSHYAETATSN